MTVETFLVLLAIFSAVTSLGTEAVKKLLDSLKVTYTSNVVVLWVAVAVGGLGMAALYELNGYTWTSFEVICTLLMIVANWFAAMLGYDKVKQTITQFKGK
jgi:predicted MFS family arabinose efflux permease